MVDQVAPGRRDDAIARWLAVLGGALAWSLHLLLCYLAISLACTFTVPLLLPPGLEVGQLAVIGLTALAAAATVAAGLVCHRRWRRSGGRGGEAFDRVERTDHYLAVAGIGLNAIFLLAIILAGIPALTLPPCR